MKVLVACEESQVVTMAFRNFGHEAYSCDIQDCSGGHLEWHIKDDVLSHLLDGWDLIIAFPPCTYLSNAGARWLYPTKGNIDPIRFEKGMQAKKFFMSIMNADCPKICAENPASSKVFDMPPHDQIIHPYMFGHPYTKKTLLRLKGLPPLKPTNQVVPVGPYVPSGTSRKIKGKYGAAKRGEDSKNRSKTFPGVGMAMAEQWG